ncbi:CerR family C-terminal domain-containing protein [Permianibacter sp. IMCC34836]|uniref:CerR family C-terminal domain-containing protein n=1 Tax=Permianibacter fluminis TaxID=2738515 RepID=UPI001557D87E|nr:CerR family C-terminal domain-containing protein [Permianibacter fluminis]NQD38792.1 CerR family C-terminal domain-containing protein [Permianibacter fluminis]
MTAAASDPRSQNTRDNLLRAGARVFARHGQGAVKLRELAAEAGTPISAIHYHFGGKDELYLAVLERLAGEAVTRFPLTAPASVPASQEDRLYLMVRHMLSRFFSNEESALLGRLLAQELANPGPALDRLVETVSRPQFGQMATLISEILGPGHSPECIRQCTLSTLGQCFVYLFAQPALSRLFPGLYSPVDIDGLARHISAFSLAGLQAIRARGPVHDRTLDQTSDQPLDQTHTPASPISPVTPSGDAP